MSPLEFFTDQAAKQALAGDQTELPNVRERCQRAAAAWSVLAAREKRSGVARDKRRDSATGPVDPEPQRVGSSVDLD